MIRKQKKGASPAVCFHEARQMVENLGIETEVPNESTKGLFSLIIGLWLFGVMI